MQKEPNAMELQTLPCGHLVYMPGSPYWHPLRALGMSEGKSMGVWLVVEGGQAWLLLG